MAEQGGNVPNVFAVEFDTGNNNTVLVRTLGVKFRGRWTRHTEHGHTMGEIMGQMPDIPGIVLEVNCRQRKAIARDPLAKDEELLRRVEAVLKRARQISSDDPLGPVPDQPFVFDDDLLKTLVDELIRMDEAGYIRVVKGELPTRDKVEQMRGDVMYDPGNSNPYKPKHRKDAKQWAERVDATPA